MRKFIHCVFQKIIWIFYFKNINKIYENNNSISESSKNKIIARIRVFKKIIFLICLLFVWGLLIFSRLIFEHWSTRIICSAGFLGLGWSLILLTYNIFRGNFARIVLFVSVAIFGISIYEYYDTLEKEDKYSSTAIVIKVANDMNNALSSFFPSRGDTNLEEIGNKQKKNNDKQIDKANTLKLSVCLYVIYHSIAYLVFGIFTMSVWGRRLSNYFQYILSLDEDKFIFWGKNLEDTFVMLGRDIYKNKFDSKVIISLLDDCIINNNDETRLYDQLNNMQLVLNFYNIQSLPFEGLFASNHLFITNDEAWNLEACMILINERKKYKINNSIDIYIRLNDMDKNNLQGDDKILTDSNDTILKYLKTSIDNPEKLRFHVFKESELIAYDFIDKHPTALAPSIRNIIDYKIAKLRKEIKFKILLLGFGGLGKKLLSYIVENSQFLMDNQPQFKSPLYVDIFDKQGETFDIYKALRIDACLKYNLTFEKCDIFSSDFLNKINNKLCEYDRIIISLGDDTLNMEAFDLICKLRKIYNSKDNLEIFVKQDQSLFKQLSLNILNSDYDSIKGYKTNIFGLNSSIYTCENIIDEKKSYIAKYINIFYFIGYNKEVNTLWNNLSQNEKQSAYSAAERIKNALYVLGYKISDVDETNEFEKLKNKILGNEHIIQCLEEFDHIRWMASMLMKGVRPWEIHERTTRKEAEENNFKPSQINSHYRHGLLVDFDKIPYVLTILANLKRMSNPNSSCHSESIDLSQYTNTSSSKYYKNVLGVVHLLLFVLEKTGLKIQKISDKID